VSDQAQPVEQAQARPAPTTFDLDQLFELVELLDRSAQLGREE